MIATIANPPTAQRALRALVVDDHPIMAEAVTTAVLAMRLFQEVRTAGSFAEAIAILEQDASFDVAILDLHLGDTSGRDSLGGIRERFPDVPVLVFTGDESIDNITMAFECGARGYATKSSPMGVLTMAVQLVIAGGSYIPPEAASILGFPQPARANVTPKLRPAPLRLSGRQDQVFKLLLQGMPNKVIAARLGMAEGTAKAHLNAVFRAIGARTRVEAILRARELGII